MDNLGFVRIGTGTPTIKVADINHNQNEIYKLIDEATALNISVLILPELCLTGYTCGDLFFQSKLIDETTSSIERIRAYTTNKSVFIVIGAPLQSNGQLYNCLIAICEGKIVGVVPKTYLPNYNEFYEERWFSSSYDAITTTIKINNIEVPFGNDLLFCHKNIKNFKIGIEICEDLWVPIPPSSYASISGATIILNGSASNEIVGKSSYRKKLLEQQSARTVSAYAYASSGYGESTTDLVFGGHCLIYENGRLLNESDRFKLSTSITFSDVDLDLLIHERMKKNGFFDSYLTKQYREIIFAEHIPSINTVRKVNPYPFVPNNEKVRNEHCEEIFSIQTFGLAKRLEHIGCEKVVLGISGGLDSTLALLVCVKTFDLLNIDRKNIIGVTMPGFGTTDRTYNNALNLMEELGITIKEISIKEASLQHFNDIGHDATTHDVTYENVQARERTQILMDLSNKEKGIVVGTGDLSELALGWATYNGDHMSMYAVNSSIPKTLVRYLINWVSLHQVSTTARTILNDVLDTPVSPELLPPTSEGEIHQKTEELVGPYELHDFYLYQVMRYGFTPKKILILAEKAFEDKYKREILLKWLKKFYYRFFSQQFKRSCLPDGPKVGSINLSPRGDWRMPSDAVVNIWIEELENLS
ncbi:MAG: NAD(+) synthase [Eubacteriales bacterium]